MIVDPKLISPEKIKQLEETHKTIGVVTDPTGKEWVVVCRKPKRTEYKMFRANANNPARQSEAGEVLLKQTCVYPESPAELEALLEEWPGIPEACSKTFIALAGMSGVEEGKL